LRPPTDVDDPAILFEGKQLTLLVLSNAKPLAPATKKKFPAKKIKRDDQQTATVQTIMLS
jgi:hypothetical protein